jgi:WD40 repeat protein
LSILDRTSVSDRGYNLIEAFLFPNAAGDRIMFLQRILAVAMLVAGTAAAQPAVDLHGDPLPPGAIARIGTVRWLHPGCEGMTYLSDGKQVLSWSNNSIRWFESETGKMLRREECPAGALVACAAPIDGKILACIGLKDKITIYNVPDWKSRCTFALAQAEAASDIAFSPSGRFVAARDASKEYLFVWDIEKAKLVQQLKAPKEPETSSQEFAKSRRHHLAFAGDDVVVACWRQWLCGWSVPDGKLLGKAKGAGEVHGELAVSPDGKIVAWDDDQQVRFFDTRFLMEVCSPRKIGPVLRLLFAPEGENLLFADGQSTGVLAWKTGKSRSFETPDCTPKAISSDGKVLVWYRSGEVGHVDLKTGKRLDKADVHCESIGATCLTPDGRLVISAAEEGLHFWDAATGKHVKRTSGLQVCSLLVSDDGMLAAGIGLSHEFAVWEVPSGKLLRSFTDQFPISGFYFPLGFDADANLILGGGPINGFRDYKYVSWDWKGSQKNGKAMPPVELRAPPAFAHAGRPWVAVQVKGVLWFVNYRGERLCRPFLEPAKSLGAVACSTCGRWAAVQLDLDVGAHWSAFRVAVVETSTGRIRFTVGAPSLMSCDQYLTLLPDGKLMVLDYGELSIRASDTGKVLTRIAGHDSSIWNFTVSRDGKRLVTLGDDATVLVWDVPALIARATPPARPVGHKELEAAWADLGDADAARAARAVELLAGAPKQSVPLLKASLKFTDAALLQRVAENQPLLDHAKFAKRQQAEKALTELGDLAEPALKARVTAKLPLEERRRVERLLERLESKPLSSATLRILRVIEVLERIGNDDARAVLQTLAAGSPLAWGTQEARAALERLGNK